MIPKIIHYCWVGGNPKPADVLSCIESWKRHCPDFEIREWNESNYDFTQNHYMKQAYDAKKWGFVPDYARLDIIYRYGGIYLDTDVELIKSPGSLLDKKGFFGFEDTGKNSYFVSCGLGFGAEKGCELIRTLRDDYDGRLFLKPDGSPDITPSPQINSHIFTEYGVRMDNSFQSIGGISFLPSEYLCPKVFGTGRTKRTKKTVSIHHFSASWLDEKTKSDIEHNARIKQIFGRKLGYRLLLASSAIKKHGAAGSAKKLCIRAYEAFLPNYRLISARLKRAFSAKKDEAGTLLLDTALCSDNLGDGIIMDACEKQLGSVADTSEMKHISTHIAPPPGSLAGSGRKILCGTNLLSCRMRSYGLWRLPRDLTDMHGVILMGVGFDSYACDPDRYTKRLLGYMLSKEGYHSVRDSFSEKCLRSMGIDNVLNTACPTMWGLTPEHCAQIPFSKGKYAVCTVTDYRRDEKSDSEMLDILLRNYERVSLWLQGKDDGEYIEKLGYSDKVILIPPSLAQYDEAASDANTDYIGTRLHAGIRALAHGRRSIVISVDNRAECISSDTGLPCIKRSEVGSLLEKLILSDFRTEIKLPEDNIRKWKEQFLR